MLSSNLPPAVLPSADSSAAEGGVREWLRSETRAAHDRVDGAPVMQALMAGRLSRSSYDQLLAHLLTLFRRFEAEHAAFLQRAATQGWPYASRAALLAHDTGLAAADAAQPQITSPTNDATGWGALYVIEGSTLGARLVAARLRATFPPDLPLRYFAHGADAPGHWPRFLRALERALAHPATHADALAGARATFAAFAHTLESIDA